MVTYVMCKQWIWKAFVFTKVYSWNISNLDTLW